MKTSLKCHCGQRLSKRDVMQQGYVRQSGPSYVYIKYRCSRCKKLGEHFVRQEEWEDSMLHEPLLEVTTEERKRFTQLGAITFEEMRHFHYALEDLNELPQHSTEEDRSQKMEDRS